MQYPTLRRALVPLTALLLAACAGNGDGLNSNGMPAAPGSTPSTPLSADFQSIQDNVFTPICTRCHSGAAAPQGLQLDAAHSYALLVGVPSNEVPSLERVKAGDPDSSYLVQKLEGASGIVGARMPFGGPYLPQSTIDVLRQWITNGAQPAAPAARAALELTATSPAADAVASRAPAELLIAFNREIDFTLVNSGSITLARLPASGAAEPVALAGFRPVAGNPAAVLVQPAQPLTDGDYELRLRGTGPAALAALDGEPLGTDVVVGFTVAQLP